MTESISKKIALLSISVTTIFLGQVEMHGGEMEKWYSTTKDVDFRHAMLDISEETQKVLDLFTEKQLNDIGEDVILTTIIASHYHYKNSDKITLADTPEKIALEIKEEFLDDLEL